MPTTLGLTSRSSPLDRANCPDAVAANDLFPLVAFSVTGLLVELLALLGLDEGGSGLMFACFVLIICAPVLAAAAALVVPRVKSS
jgi:hypothetical protein